MCQPPLCAPFLQVDRLCGGALRGCPHPGLQLPGSAVWHVWLRQAGHTHNPGLPVKHWRKPAHGVRYHDSSPALKLKLTSGQKIEKWGKYKTAVYTDWWGDDSLIGWLQWGSLLRLAANIWIVTLQFLRFFWKEQIHFNVHHFTDYVTIIQIKCGLGFSYLHL